MKLLLAILFILNITGCGVNGGSGGSSNAPAYADNNGDDPTNGGDDDNTTSPDDNNTTPDDGNTDPDDGNTDPDDDNTIDPEDSIFDTTGNVIYDANACNATLYRTARDASYNGDSESENGSSYFIVENEGLNINSLHNEGSPSNAGKTWVTLYYKSFPTKNDLGLQGSASYELEDFFSLIYDNAWADESISNVNNTVYIKSLKTEKPSCYRLGLNSVSDQEADLQKVYR